MKIKVDLEVDDVFIGDEVVRVSGYVGDYHVSVFLPADDPACMELRGAKMHGLHEKGDL